MIVKTNHPILVFLDSVLSKKKGKPFIIIRKIRKYGAIRLGKNLEQYDNIHINTVIKYKGFLGKSIDLILFITTSLS